MSTFEIRGHGLTRRAQMAAEEIENLYCKSWSGVRERNAAVAEVIESAINNSVGCLLEVANEQVDRKTDTPDADGA